MPLKTLFYPRQRNFWIDVRYAFAHALCKMTLMPQCLFSSTKEKANKDEIGMKSSKSEEAVLLQGVNGDKKSPTE